MDMLQGGLLRYDEERSVIGNGSLRSELGRMVVYELDSGIGSLYRSTNGPTYSRWRRSDPGRRSSTSDIRDDLHLFQPIEPARSNGGERAFRRYERFIDGFAWCFLSTRLLGDRP